MKQVGKLNPFGRFCCSIGNLPTSYMESLTYEQQLLWFCKFLDTEVIPAVNANAEAIIELQNYLKNLDLQEEVNNKLDEMAESGQLTDIIAQYLQLAGLLCFNTKADLKAAQNLVDGSFAKTFGTTTYNDGYGYFYKIRTLINTDVIDDDNLLALTDYPTLVAEKIPDSTINNILTEIDTLQNKNHRYVIMIGDSFGHLNDGNITKFYWEYFQEALGLTTSVNFFAKFTDGSGFINGHYLQDLQELAGYCDKSKVTDIFVCGGWNDSIGNDTDYNTAVAAFNTYVKANFPKALVTIAHISWGNPTMTNNYEVFMQLPVSIKRYINTANIYGYRYLAGTENILHDYTTTLWQADGTHPSQSGQELLGKSIVAPFLTGACSVHKAQTSTVTASGIATTVNDVTVFNYLDNDFVRAMVAVQSAGMPIIFDCDGSTLNMTGSANYEIGTLNSPYLSGFSETNGVCVPVNIWGVALGSDNSFECMATFFCDRGKLYMRPMLIGSKNFVNVDVSKIVITDFGFSTPALIS